MYLLWFLYLFLLCHIYIYERVDLHLAVFQVKPMCLYEYIYLPSELQYFFKTDNRFKYLTICKVINCACKKSKICTVLHVTEDVFMLC
jgi:hypothetical protein